MSSQPHAKPAISSDAAIGGATATLADVYIVGALLTRPTRQPDYERGHHAFVALSAEMAEHPRNMLQKLAEVAVELCGANTAGISLLDGDVFRWEAVAGVCASARGGTMPRDASPCGVCIDRNSTQLMHMAERCFPALKSDPPFVESLLIPFHAHGKAIGTVWVVSHEAGRTFDAEDERTLSALSKFAAAGWQAWRASEAVTEHNRRQDDFIATLSHELRNPLAAIVAAGSLLQHYVAGDSRAMRPTQVVVRQSKLVSRLIEDLLDITRIDSGKLQLEKRTVDLRAVISETVESRRAQIERRRHSLSVELGAAPVLVDVDPIRLALVVSNLMDNASKYTPENGRISVALSTEADEVVVAVSDNGVGIPADRTESIFQAFTQLHESRDSSAGGLGLGLALVRSLTALHGGTVNVASAGLGQGSCFTVRLPVRRSSAPLQANA